MRNVLIVGATSAIAHATARHFAAAGDRLFLTGRDPAKLDAVAGDLRVRGADRIETFLLDVNEFDHHVPLLDAAEAALGGPLDIAYIAHGVLPDQKACETDVDVMLAAVRTNTLSVFALLTPLANRFEARRAGTIAVITSVAGDRGRKYNYVYGASKAAVDAFLSGLRNRLAGANVAVVTLKPGPIDTPMTRTHRKSRLFTSADKAGADIYRAIVTRKDVVYVPAYWRAIMAAVKGIPESVFKRTNLAS